MDEGAIKGQRLTLEEIGLKLTLACPSLKSHDSRRSQCPISLLVYPLNREDGWKEQLNLLSRPRGTGSAGAGRAREDLDFITRLLGVGLCCLAVPVVSCVGIPLKHQRELRVMTYVRHRDTN